MPSGSDPGIVEHEPGDLTCIVDGALRLSALQAALGRHGQRFSLDPPGDPTLADCLLARSLGAAAPPVRDDARPRDRRRRRAARRHPRPLGRQGREERRGLRPRQALLRLGGPARDRRAARAAAASPPGRGGDDRRRAPTVGASCTAPGSSRARSTSSPTGCTSCSKARRRRWPSRRPRFGGERVEPWDEVRELQAGLPGRARWDGGSAPLVRPGPRVAYVEQAEPPAWSPLAERVLEALCSPN